MVLDLEEARRRLEKSRDIPTLSPVAARIHECVNDPASTSKELSALIARDPGLTAATLRLVNSAYYGLSRKIGNVTRAIVLLGFQRVRYMALTASVIQSLRRSRSRSFDYRGFWIHSLGTGLAAEALALYAAPDWAEDAFAAGLLHDVGKLALSVAFRKEWMPLPAKAREGAGRLIVEVERECLGFDHAMAGGWLAEQWHFPRSLAEAIQHHHAPAQAKVARELVEVVHVADVLVRGVGLGDPGDDLVPAVDPESWASVGFEKRGPLEKFYVELFERFERASSLLQELS